MIFSALGFILKELPESNVSFILCVTTTLLSHSQVLLA